MRHFYARPLSGNAVKFGLIKFLHNCGSLWFGEGSSVSDKKDEDKGFIERRRQLLKLGAAGVPMVLTLKASATQPVHSALDCAFVIPEKVTILVDVDGKAWVGDGSIQEKQGEYKTKDVDDFKQNADYVFGEGTVPERYRPDGCSTGGGDDDSGDDDGGHGGWGGDDSGGDDDDSGWHSGSGDDDDSDWRTSSSSRGDDDGGYSGGWRGGHGGGDDDGDDDDGGSGGGGWTDCYKVYVISRNTTITPADYLNGSGSWNLQGENGLYILLAGKYLDTYGNDGGFPGISCLLSILNYLETQ